MDQEIDQKPSYWLLLFASGVRIAIFILIIICPIKDQEGQSVSPLIEQSSLDTAFYQQARQQYVSLDFSNVTQKLKNFYENPAENHAIMLSLPLFPLLLHVFNYTKGNTIYLSSFYLCLSVALSWLWLYWLSNKQLPRWSLWVFAILPNPIWFMLAVSTDLLFALIFAVFFILYSEKPIKKKAPLYAIPLLGMLLTRPNSVSILLFVIADKFYNNQGSSYNKTINIIALIILLPLSLFMIPYFWAFIGASYKLSFFNISSKEYMEGLFTWLPSGINQFVSWACFAGAKILYFVGLRPSYGSTSLILVLIRSAIGVFLLPGIIYLFLRGDKRHKILFSIYFIPIFLGASQDRYNLPIQPILYYYGVLSIIALKNKLKP